MDNNDGSEGFVGDCYLDVHPVQVCQNQSASALRRMEQADVSDYFDFIWQGLRDTLN
jgi:hypothetical protein